MTQAAPDFLAQMAELSRERCAAARARTPIDRLRESAQHAPPPIPLTLSSFDLIAEIKPASPAEGPLRVRRHSVAADAEDPLRVSRDSVAADAEDPLRVRRDSVAADAEDPLRVRRHSVAADADLLQRALAYQAAGAAAISVLTEPSRFHASLELLAQIAAHTSIPVMRKDFLTDPYQVVEARAAGASGVLLIARILDDDTLDAMLDQAAALAMFTLTEAFDAPDLQRITTALERAGARATQDPYPAAPMNLVGLNCRDLATLRIDTTRFTDLAAHFPPSHPRVAESGIHTPADAARVARLNYHLALVGTALMRADDPEQAARDIINAGRQARP